MNFDILKVIKINPFSSTHHFNGVLINKDEDDWIKEEREKVYCSLKVKSITTAALGLDEFLCVFYCETAIEI